MRSVAILALLFSSALPAQVVHVANYGGGAVDVWRRVVVDVPLRVKAGKLPDGSTFVAGSEFGIGLRVVDVHLQLAGGAARSLDLSRAVAGDVPAAVPPADLADGVTVAGVRLAVVEAAPNAAGVDVHLRGRVGRMFAVDVWLTWWPGAVAAAGEAVVTCSNPAVPDLVEAAPAGGLALDWPGGAVFVAGGIGGELLAGGEMLADGQARALPFAVVWRRELTPDRWASAAAVVQRTVGAIGLASAWPQGQPSIGELALQWSRREVAAARALQRASVAGPLGVNAYSGQTGPAEDQVFVGGELAQGLQSAGAEEARYLTALRELLRPCHHLEVGGELLRLAAHRRLVMWDGRAHWSPNVSPDQLGKPRGLSMLETGGWWGPDVEHAMQNTRAVALRATGSPALQWDLHAAATVYLAQWTVAAGLSTSQPYAARALLWESLLAFHCWHLLDDRTLAAAVRERWNARATAIIIPQLGARGDWWDVRRDDRLGPGLQVMPYQQAMGAYGLDLVGALFGRADVRALALAGARRTLDAWREVGGRFVAVPVMSTDGAGEADAGWNLYGMPLGVAVVLRQQPQDARARAIWLQLVGEARGDGHWLAPELLR